MKAAVFLIFIFFFQQEKLNSQQSSIRGVVSVFNSETDNGVRKYVPYAQVKDNFNKANPAATDASGKFDLVFVGISDNETVSFNVIKNGWEVVNIDALSAIAGQRDTVKISMATHNKIAAYRMEIYQIGLSEAEKPLNELLQKKNKELNDLKKSSTRNEEKIKQLERELANIEAQSKKIDGEARELATKYALINLDDASPLFRDAFNLFKKGNLDSALVILANVNLANQVHEILQLRKKLAALQKEINEKDSTQKQRTADVGEALQFKADLHKTRYEYDSTSYCFELLLQLDSSNIDYQFNYASFLQWLNQYDKALTYYSRILDSCNLHLASNPQIYEPFLAKVQNKLGNHYFDKNDFAKAESSYVIALQIRRKIAESNPQLYEADLAQTLNNLGNLYLEKHEFIKAEISFYESLKIRKRLAENDEENAKRALGQTLHNLGNLYYRKNDYKKADSAYKAALEIRKHLAKYHNQELNEPDVAETQINLGSLYVKENDLPGAASAFGVAYDIYKRLSLKNPQTYLPLVATIQNNMGNLYYNKNDLAKAEEAYKSALEIRSTLAKDDPETFQPDLANTYYNMGIFYTKKNDYEKAKANYEASYTIKKKLVALDINVYGADFSFTCNALGKIYIQLKDYSKAEAVFVESLNTLEKLITDSSNILIKDASVTAILLLKTYSALYITSTTETDKQLLQKKQVAIENKLDHWAAKDPGAAKNYAEYYGSLAKYLLFSLKFKEAEQLAEKGLSIDSSLNDIKAILAPALLFQDRYEEALKIYMQLKLLKNDAGKSWAELCLQDLDALDKKGATNINIEKVRELLNH